MKTIKHLLSVFLIAVVLVMQFAVLTIPETACAQPIAYNQANVYNRIYELYNKLGGEKAYFGVNRNGGCGKKSKGHGCDNCDLQYVVQADWFKNLFGTLSVSQFPVSYDAYPDGPDDQYYIVPEGPFGGRGCFGFAIFAEWYIFKGNNTDQVITMPKGRINFDYEGAGSLRTGDLLRLDTNHSAIFIERQKNGILVLDNNWSGTYNCTISIHTIRYSSYKYCSVSRALTFPADIFKGAWYYDAVSYVFDNRILVGYSSGPKEGLFGFADKIQRQDFIVALSRYDGYMEYYYGNGGFKDVDPNSYYADAVVWSSQNNIANGYTSGSKAGYFGVGDYITREQLVAFMYRYADYIGANTSVTTTADDWREKYDDFDSVSDFAREATIWALEKGVISGKTVNGKVCIAPQGDAQRCEVAQIFYNIDQKNIFAVN